MNIKYLPALPHNLAGISSVDYISYENPLEVEILIDCIHLKQVLIALDGPRIVGYICYQDIKNGKLILGLAVMPTHRRKGIASQLVQFVKELEDAEKIQVNVREKNLEGQLFLNAIGFNCFQILKDYYDEVDEPCYVFTYYIGHDIAL